MPRFLRFLIFGIILIFLSLEFLNLTKNDFFNPLAAVEDVFQKLINKYSFQKNELTEVALKKDRNLEIDKDKTETSLEKSKEPILEMVSALDEIMEKIDEISEKIDIISAETDKLLKESDEKENKNELLEEEETKETEKNEDTEKSEQKEEKENREEPKEEVVKTEESPVVYCKRGEGNPARNKVIFNEISWMGTILDWRNEWLELKNISGDSISLKNWQILDKDQEIKIIFEEKDEILTGKLFLLERTNDDSVLNIIADKIYSGNLNDEDEILYLFDENCQLQDEILASPNWPAGDKNERKSMERDSDLTWYTYSGGSNYGIFGTPKAENSAKFIYTSSGGGEPPEEVSPLKILITELKILPTKERFIELYNPNSNEVDLTDWYIQRKTKTGSSWTSLVSSTQFEGKTIQGKSYFLITRLPVVDSDISLEGLTLTEDNVILLKNPGREIVDKVGWGQAQDFETASAENPLAGKSLGRKWNGETQEYLDTDNNQEDFEIQESTPKAKNLRLSIPLLILEDTVPPQVNFDSLLYLQTELYFSLSWVGQDSALENVTPSGIDGFYLKYDVITIEDTVSPSDIDGIVIQYQDNNNDWQDWKSGEILEFGEDQNSLSLLVEDLKIYNFEIWAVDKANNISERSGIIIEINTASAAVTKINSDRRTLIFLINQVS